MSHCPLQSTETVMDHPYQRSGVYCLESIPLHGSEDLQDAQVQIDEVHVQTDRGHNVILRRVSVENHISIWGKKLDEQTNASNGPCISLQLTKNDVSWENENTGKSNGKLESFGEWEEDLDESYENENPERCVKAGRRC